MNICSLRRAGRSHERGAVLIYVAILTLAFIGLIGLALDGAFVSRTKQQLQHGADAAALNAVRYLDLEPGTDYPVTRDAALDVAVANEAAKLTIKLDPNAGNAADGDVVVGYWDAFDKTFTPTIVAPNAVRVRARRTSDNPDGPLSLLFGPVFGATASDVRVMSTAVLAPPAPPLVLILDPTGNAALRINGTNYLYCPTGRVHANSSAACGISLVGTPQMIAAKTTVVGGACNPDGVITGPVIEDSDVIPDPLAGVLPTAASWNTFKDSLPMPLGPAGQITATGTYDPGYYPRGLDAQSTTVITLNPGSYMFGDDVKLGGSAYVYGSNVTLFIDKNEELDISGSGAGMQLTPPGASSPFYGVTIFMHRETTGTSVCKIGGGGDFKVEGIAYVPGGELVMGGTPGKELGGIIAFRASTDGTTGFLITGKGVPPLTSDPKSSYLVE
ncbi:MAG TPA: TadE/TadG family type IV pilus assembly protein [Planctomycetota bacterium]|nr:TadE/TadG family type IV pilus assembly protein [Planctomycetota bacterium]